MSSPSTRETLTIFDKAEFLIMSTLTQKGTVSSSLTETFVVPNTAGEVWPPFDWDGTQDRNASLLAQTVREVRRASQAYRLAKIHVAEFTRGRLKGANVLRSHYRAMQKAFVGSCGPEALKVIGLDVPPVRPILGVREQGIFILGRLRDPELPVRLAALPRLVGAAPHPDLTVLGDDLERDLQAFEEMQTALTQAKKVRDEAYLTRKETRKSLRGVVVNVARVQEGYYRLAGLHDLADRIRLTIRKGSKKVDPLPTDSPSTDSPAIPPTP